MISSNLLRYNLKNRKFLIWDGETENLSLTRAKIWDLSWSIYQGNVKIEEHQYYIKWPNLKVNKDAALHTRFDPKVIEKYGQDPKKIIDLFDSYIYNSEYDVVGANILGYDIYTHNVCRNELGYHTDYSYLERIYDTVAFSRTYKLGIKIPENKKEYIPLQYRMLNIKKRGMKSGNKDMAKEFGIDTEDDKLHGALYDSSVTAKVFFTLINKIEIQ